MRVRIEREVCTGAGDCARDVPDVFVMADDGLAMVHDGGVPVGEDEGAVGFTRWVEVAESLEVAVEQAAARCPGTCIVVEQTAPEPEPVVEDEPAPTPPPRSSIPERIAFRVRRLFS